MLALLRQRRWLGFTVFVLAMVVLCVLLSRWQWHRYHIRTAENARLEAATSAPVTPIDQVLAATPAGTQPGLAPELEWRMVTASGAFDAAGEVAVRRRPLDGTNGFWIVTPLVTDAGTVLVNRGWVPADGADAQATPRVPAPPAGPVTVTGRLRAPERSGRTDPPPGQAWDVDPDVLVQSGDQPRYDAYIQMRSSSPDSSIGLVMLQEDPARRGLNNLVYTGQWLLFALVGIFGWWRLLSREAQDQVRRSTPPGSAHSHEVTS